MAPPRSPAPAPPPRPGRRRRLLLGGAAALALVLLPAAPAAADPPGPTDYRSEVVRVHPAVEGVRASVAGGDAFLLIEVVRGHTVTVPGYDAGDPEPYLRVLADGRVQENQASVAFAVNQSRDGTGDADTAGGPPRWRTVATDGRWAWHDHRIHNMADRAPPAARTDTGLAWEVPLVVDGEPVTVAGRYRLLDGPTPLPWLGLALVLAAATVLVARRLPPVTVAGLAVLVAGSAGVVAGVAQRAASPPGAPTSPLVVVLPAVAAVAGVIAVLQRGRVLRAVAALAGAAAAGGWALVRAAVLWRAVLPTDLPAGVDRAATAAALGVAAGAAVVVVRSGALAPPPADIGAQGAPGPDVHPSTT
ncbi:MAG TPA: hypothetical protein VEW93_08760 [Acidimicrobiales bacterium]|nr:hypothetical protein [Acidimicrobiales bacterium]